MKIFRIDPYRSEVAELEENLTTERLDELVGGSAAEHYIVEVAFPGHTGYVNELGIKQRRRLWFFRETHVWGPMVILDEHGKLTAEQVRAVCRI